MYTYGRPTYYLPLGTVALLRQREWGSKHVCIENYYIHGSAGHDGRFDSHHTPVLSPRVYLSILNLVPLTSLFFEPLARITHFNIMLMFSYNILFCLDTYLLYLLYLPTLPIVTDFPSQRAFPNRRHLPRHFETRMESGVGLAGRVPRRLGVVVGLRCRFATQLRCGQYGAGWGFDLLP